MLTISVWFDRQDPGNPGYCARVDSGESEPINGTVRRCASGPRPPAAVERTVRETFDLQRRMIRWYRAYDFSGWTGEVVGGSTRTPHG